MFCRVSVLIKLQSACMARFPSRNSMPHISTTVDSTRRAAAAAFPAPGAATVAASLSLQIICYTTVYIRLLVEDCRDTGGRRQSTSLAGCQLFACQLVAAIICLLLRVVVQRD